MSWRDPNDFQYRIDWQSALAKGGRAQGMKRAFMAQQYISQLRAMHRLLLRKSDVTRQDWKRIFDRPGFRNQPARWITDRGHARLRRAIDRGESQKSLERKRYYDPLKDHQLFRGTTKRVRQALKRRRHL